MKKRTVFLCFILLISFSACDNKKTDVLENTENLKNTENITIQQNSEINNKSNEKKIINFLKENYIETERLQYLQNDSLNEINLFLGDYYSYFEIINNFAAKLTFYIQTDFKSNVNEAVLNRSGTVEELNIRINFIKIEIEKLEKKENNFKNILKETKNEIILLKEQQELQKHSAELKTVYNKVYEKYIAGSSNKFLNYNSKLKEFLLVQIEILEFIIKNYAKIKVETSVVEILDDGLNEEAKILFAKEEKLRYKLNESGKEFINFIAAQ